MKKLSKITAIKMRKSGESIPEIASKLNVSKSSVSLWVRHLPATKEMRKAFNLKLKMSEDNKKKASLRMKKYHKDNPKTTRTVEQIKNWRNNYNKQYYHSRRKWAIAYLGGKCVRCNTTKKLEFDHIEYLKKTFCIGAHLTHAKKKLIKELDKCQLLCHPCHLQKNREEGSAFVGGVKGEDVHCSKLRDEDIQKIIELIFKKIPIVQIAKKFNVSRSTISHIKQGRTWKHVPRIK